MLPDNHLYSTLLGYIGLATSALILLPQIFVVWRRKSGKGVSLTMLWLWLAGDLTSLVGIVVQGLLHTLIIVGVISSVICLGLIGLCYHYADWEQLTPLLVFLRLRQPPIEPTTAPDSPELASKLSPVENQEKSRRSTILHIVFVLSVIGISVMIWGLVVARVRYTATLRSGDDGTDPEFTVLGAVFGWVGMVIFSGSRFPQIYKNWRSKACHNLSIWSFILLMVYNLSNVASILVKSHSRNYIIVNLPWIVGSSLNVFIDAFIMGQVFWYERARRSGPAVESTSPIQESEQEEKQSV